MATITAANAVLMLSVANLFPTPVQMQQFAADDIFDTEEIEPAETIMGVDGHLSAGFVPVPVNQNITLMPDSPSIIFFENWIAAQQQAQELYVATGTVRLLSVHRTYAMTRGFLTRYPPTPAAKRTLQPRRFQIRWQRVQSAPI